MKRKLLDFGMIVAVGLVILLGMGLACRPDPVPIPVPPTPDPPPLPGGALVMVLYENDDKATYTDDQRYIIGDPDMHVLLSDAGYEFYPLDKDVTDDEDVNPPPQYAAYWESADLDKLPWLIVDTEGDGIEKSEAVGDKLAEFWATLEGM